MKRNTVLCLIFLIIISGCRKEDVLPPEIWITTPENNALVSENANLILEAEARDDNDIAYVCFVFDGLPFYDFDEPYICDLQDTLGLGQHSFFVYASDVFGNISDRIESGFSIYPDHSPVAHFYVDEYIGQIGDEFVFHADSSSDNETIFENLLFRWDWDGDEIWDTDRTSGTKFTHVYDEMGDNLVTLEVTDEHDNPSFFSRRIVCRGTFTDPRDNNIYKMVKIGEQTWMAENLNYISGSGSLCYENDDGNCEKYGRLYDFDAALAACPDGWRLPLDSDWLELESYAGLDSTDLENAHERLSGSIGTKLKSSTGWDEEGNGNDDYGFSILPGGHYTNSNFYWIGTAALFWSAGDRFHNTYPVYVRQFRSDSQGNYRQFSKERTGYLSVRCVKEL